jgi:hypothetical protein
MKIIMLFLSFTLLILSNYRGDSPHGPDFKISCSTCHSPKGWELDRSVYSFNHDETLMPLTGQHTNAECRQCHPSLVFSDAENECVSCHADHHQATVGSDCSRCHHSGSWLVSNINDIHRMSRFPSPGSAPDGRLLTSVIPLKAS